MLPDNNLPTLLGINPDADALIAAALGGRLSLDDSLARLSAWFLVRAWFLKPIYANRKESDVHLFRSFFISRNGLLCHANRRKARTGHIFHSTYLITKLEFLQEKNSAFKSFEDFKRKFDPRFIKEKQILSLWNSKSSQHGKQYNKKDFRKISKRGKEVMERFLRQFTNINEHNHHYHKSDLWGKDVEVWILSHNHKSWHHSGRDISISHQTNAPHVFYSSEFHNCCNGRYGILANEKEYLWLEDD